MKLRKNLFPLIAAGVMAVVLASAVNCARAQDTAVAANLTSAEIVASMEHNNQTRAENLKHFTAVRHYAVEYKGFPGNASASLDVEVNYDAPASKRFRVVGQSGSQYLIDHVLMPLVKGERDACLDQHGTALSQENYKFVLVGTEQVNGRAAYVLKVDPLAPSKYLYRGKVWVDAVDFAVMKIEAEPAKNPSFWISKAEIHHVYAKQGDFWLPETNRTETYVRTGGSAILTIDYGKYTHLNEGPVQTASVK